MRDIIRKILKDSFDDDFDLVNPDEINHSKWDEEAKIYGGPRILARDAYNNDPMQFLNMFNDLDVVQSEENPDWILFRYEPKENIIIYNLKNNYVYLNYTDIYGFLAKGFGLKHPEIKGLIQNWLSKTYNLKGIKPNNIFNGQIEGAGLRHII